MNENISSSKKIIDIWIPKIKIKKIYQVTVWSCMWKKNEAKVGTNKCSSSTTAVLILWDITNHLIS